MDTSSPRRFSSPLLILGLFLAAFLGAVWLLLSRSGGPDPLMMLAVVLLGVLGLLLFNRMSAQVKDALEALDQGETYIERVADLSQDVHALIDADTQAYLYVNQALDKALGYTPEEFLAGGLAFFQELVHPEDRHRVKDQWERLLDRASKPPARREDELVQEEVYRIRAKWGEYRWFRSRRVVFSRHASGAPWEILSVVHDISEQRAYEAALVHAHGFESLGLLARRIAHDLNNILMGIQGYADLALQGQSDPDRLREALRHIGENNGRATQLCRQMLAYAGRGRVQMMRHQLNDSIREGLPLVESLMPENVQLVLELEPDLPKVNGDPNQVRYALLNLVMNAMESLGNAEGEITIRTQLRHLEGERDGLPAGVEDDFVCLEVKDTGTGMSEDTLSGIFDPFFRTQHPGRGLGMLTVQGIAREHQGALAVESVPGKGSTFRLAFPVAEKAPELDEGDEGTPVTGMNGVVLLVDDEPSIRATLKQGLELGGYKVIEAADGVEGFGAFVRHRSSIGLVMLDLTMPRMGGDEVFEEIRKVAPEMPVILMSGYSQQEALENLKGRGLAGFLSKPCTMKEVLAAVRKALGQTLS